MSDIRRGDEGTVATVSIKEDGEAIDISDATLIKVQLKKPDGKIDERIATFTTDGTNGKIDWTFEHLDSFLVGDYALQVEVQEPSNTWLSSVTTFSASDNLEDIQVAGTDKIFVADVTGANFDARLSSAVTMATSAGKTVVIGTSDNPGFFVNALTVPPNVALEFDGGSIDFSTATGILNIQGPVRADKGEIFIMPLPANRAALRLTFYDVDFISEEICSRHIGEIPIEWFDDNGDDDLGLRVNKAFRAGGHRASLVIGAYKGDFSGGAKQMLRTSIDFTRESQGGWYSDVKFSGHGMPIGSTMVMKHGTAFVGINVRQGDEIHLENLRVIQQGSRQSCCVLLGGVDNHIQTCWFGNSKYGIVNQGGLTNKIIDCAVEACDNNMIISGVFTETIAGMETAGKSTHLNVESIQLHNAHEINLQVEGEVEACRIVDSVFKQGKIDITVTGTTFGDIGVVFDNCTMTECDRIVSPYSAGVIDNAKVVWNGGFIYNNPDYVEYEADGTLGSAATCGFYVDNGSEVHFNSVTRGNTKDPTQTSKQSQHSMFVRADDNSIITDRDPIYMWLDSEVTTARLEDKDDSINFQNRWPGQEVWNTTTTRPLRSAGYLNTDVWVDDGGSTVHTPV